MSTQINKLVSQTKKKKAPKTKNFSSFDVPSAFKQLGIKNLHNWKIEAPAIAPSDFFKQRLVKLESFFDLRNYEESKKLIIDALCEEGMETSRYLKVWKGALLRSDVTGGNVDYLIAEKKAYLEAPMLCIVEAKKDDFEQGLAQCLVEMQACQWNNLQLGHSIEVLGIITNGETWRFYKLTTDQKVYETLPYAMNNLDTIIGALRFIFEQCEKSLLNVMDEAS
jgi:hypothetical protein